MSPTIPTRTGTSRHKRPILVGFALRVGLAAALLALAGWGICLGAGVSTVATLLLAVWMLSHTHWYVGTTLVVMAALVQMALFYQFATKSGREIARFLDAIAFDDTNARYRALLGFRTNPPIPMASAHVILDSRGPFADTRLANAGREKGVKVGNPVMSENGLVGRVIGVTDGASRVLLLTDIASRTQVMIDRTNARAILTGANLSGAKLSGTLMPDGSVHP